MLTSFSSNAIAAKARAIYGKRLTVNNYNDLLRLSTVADVCAYLKNNTSYSKYLKGIDESTIHRGQLENLLKRSRIEKYLSLCQYDFSSNNSFYQFAITNAEIHIILNTIILLGSHNTTEIISKIPSYLQDYSCLDFKEIANVKSYDDLIKVLEHTPYRNILKSFMNSNDEINYRDCEHSLKTFYYNNLIDTIEKSYTGKTRATLLQMVKTEVDITNLGIIYRLRKYFNAPPEEVKRYLLPFYYKLNPKTIEDLLSTTSKEDFIQKMRLNAYTVKMQSVNFNYIEDYTKRLKNLLSRKMMRFSTHAPIPFYALSLLTEIEVDNIIKIIEGIRYQNESSQIQKLLILE
ncbi:V-type ATPase subunit [Paludicola sp. MB14-C6]|uniref:V-type ATPase subunit n=1 Tax=Paludihabitans sp. MB14-C6 TaxID=3070656 RepID=UPI0027DEA7C7|nr:V-type ATPase subunit [Paludicola sp. MB14-C6]WMJ22613.1 V-type ATPase subunit [Paludicola sp. MB14-C6]